MRLEDQNQTSYHLPRLGGRIIKTSIAVFICLIIYQLRGYEGMPGQSTIAAIVCMQPFVHDSKKYAIDRVAGTLLGALLGQAVLIFLSKYHMLRFGMPVVFAIEALGVMLTLYLCVAIKFADSASLCAIVFLCVVIDYPYIEDPIASSIDRVLDTLIGTLVAIAVNVVHLPRGKNERRLFFIQVNDLVPDRYAHISNAVLIGLQRLYESGAKVCMISEHAPAFFIPQLGTLKINVPMIVMDGAAMYDLEEKEYKNVMEMERSVVHNVTNLLDGMNEGYYINAIRSNSLMIYHRGPQNLFSEMAYQEMKRSPYRNYVQGDYADEDKIVFLKMIDCLEHIREVEKTLQGILPKSQCRIVVRPQKGRKNTYALYVFPADATVENMKRQVLKSISQEDWYLPTDVFSKTEYRTERDALHVINRVKDLYEPVSFRAFFRRFRKKH